MKSLKRFIPQEMQDNLNQNPLLKWMVLILMVGIGILLIHKGIRGIRTKSIESKGTQYTGTPAVMVASGFVFAGSLLVVGSALVGSGAMGTP